MGEVVAGWAAGYSMSIFSTFAFVYLLVRSSDSTLITRYTHGEMNPLILSVPASIGSFFLWTMTGLVIGSAYKLFGTTDVPGEIQLPFVIVLAALALMPIPILLIFWPRRWWLWCGMSGIFLGLFAWFMPLMAKQFYP